MFNEALVAVSARAGLALWIPPDVAGHCCATPWSSKGYRSGQDLMAAKTAAALRFGVVDTILKEPVGGAHRDPATMISATGEAIGRAFDELRGLDGGPAQQ